MKKPYVTDKANMIFKKLKMQLYNMIMMCSHTSKLSCLIILFVKFEAGMVVESLKTDQWFSSFDSFK